MNLPSVVSRSEWETARKELLEKEKELTRARDAINAARRRLPMVEIEQNYIFQGPDGPLKLSDLFEGRRQLIVYRFFYANAGELDIALGLRSYELKVALGVDRETVALVGPSGAGKSSLVGALLKLYPLQRGRVLLDDRPLESLDGDALRRRIAVIAQQTVLFNQSLLDNLLLAAPDASAADIERAVSLAQLDPFVASLPDGYDTVLGEAGARVSGGEARRISIARALLQDAPVLVLDEPTEGLDARTARDLYSALAAAGRDRTLLLITHRLSGLARLVDEVVIMRAGRVHARVAVEEYLAR